MDGQIIFTVGIGRVFRGAKREFLWRMRGVFMILVMVRGDGNVKVCLRIFGSVIFMDAKPASGG